MATKRKECSQEQLAEAAALVAEDEQKGAEQVEALVGEFPDDPRLRFLFGSVLAALGCYPEAHEQMTAAVRLAPTYAIARFQLGFLELSSGDPLAAAATWGPLRDLPADHPLCMLAGGLEHMIHDEFSIAIEQLERGIALNAENSAVNADMRLLIDGMRDSLRSARADAEPTSAAHLLLQQYAAKATRH